MVSREELFAFLPFLLTEFLDMNRPARLFLLLLSLLCPTPLLAEDGWTVDYEAARKLAQETSRDLLLEFTGSDWCPPCKALAKRILTQDAFVKQMSRDFVLVKLDYPRDKSKQSKTEIDQNEKLKKEYQIRGYPTVILADAQGIEYDREVGFKGEGLRAYVKAKLTLRAQRTGRNIELDSSLFPEQSEDDAAFSALFTALDGRRIQHVILCAGSEEGIQKIDAFLRQFPDSKHREEALYLRAVSYWSMGRYLDAAPAFETFVRTVPDSRLANLARIRQTQSLLRADRPAQALDAIESYGDALSNAAATQATALSLLGRNEEALKCLDAAIQQNQGSRMAGALGVQRQELAWIGKPLPEFTVSRFGSEESISPSSFKGKVLLIDFWATWCRPCMREMPVVKSMYTKYRDQGFEIFGVSLDTKEDSLVNILTSHEMNWPQYFDGKRFDNDLAKLFQVRRVPNALLVDAEGIVRYASLRGANLDRLVKELIAEAATAKTK